MEKYNPQNARRNAEAGHIIVGNSFYSESLLDAKNSRLTVENHYSNLRAQIKPLEARAAYALIQQQFEPDIGAFVHVPQVRHRRFKGEEGRLIKIRDASTNLPLEIPAEFPLNEFRKTWNPHDVLLYVIYGKIPDQNTYTLALFFSRPVHNPAINLGRRILSTRNQLSLNI